MAASPFAGENKFKAFDWDANTERRVWLRESPGKKSSADLSLWTAIHWQERQLVPLTSEVSFDQGANWESLFLLSARMHLLDIVPNEGVDPFYILRRCEDCSQNVIPRHVRNISGDLEESNAAIREQLKNRTQHLFEEVLYCEVCENDNRPILNSNHLLAHYRRGKHLRKIKHSLNKKALDFWIQSMATCRRDAKLITAEPAEEEQLEEIPAPDVITDSAVVVREDLKLPIFKLISILLLFIAGCKLRLVFPFIPLWLIWKQWQDSSYLEGWEESYERKWKMHFGAIDDAVGALRDKIISKESRDSAHRYYELINMALNHLLMFLAPIVIYVCVSGLSWSDIPDQEQVADGLSALLSHINDNRWTTLNNAVLIYFVRILPKKEL